MSVSGISGATSYYGYSLQTQSTYQADREEMATQLAAKMLEDMDADSSGSLSASEIGVDSDLLTSADSDGDGVLSESELIGLLSSMGPPPMPPQGAEGAQGGQGGQPPDASELFSALDTDEDGVVSQAEFIAGHPEEVTEEQAAEMWSQISSGADSMTQEEFVSAMEAMGPPPGGGPGGPGGASGSGSAQNLSSVLSSDDDDEDDETTELDLNAMLAEILANYGKAQYQQSMDGSIMDILTGGGVSTTA